MFDTLLPSTRPSGDGEGEQGGDGGEGGGDVQGSGEEEGEGVWEYIFLVLEEDEDANTLWWRGGRWIWAGRFEEGMVFERGGGAGDRPYTENPNVAGDVFAVEGG